MTKKLKVVHIGTGGFGEYWSKDVLPYLVNELQIVELVAAVDIDANAHKNVIESVGISPEKCYLDARQALEENEADIVHVVVPPALHEEMVDLALEFDCHILSEKPIADTMEASCRIYKKVKRAGKKMAITMSHRFDQDKQTLESLIKSKQYGELDYIISRFTCQNRHYPAWGHFRYGIEDPLLIEGSVHHFDIIRSLSGSNAKTVYANSWNPSWSDFKGDSNALVNIVMENGVKAVYEGAKCNSTTMNGWAQEYFRAECELGTLEMNHREVTVQSHLGFPEPTYSKIPLKKQNSWTHRWIAEMFIEWVNGGDAPPSTLEDNIQCTALLFAAIKSVHTGEVVDVQKFLKENMELVHV